MQQAIVEAICDKLNIKIKADNNPTIFTRSKSKALAFEVNDESTAQVAKRDALKASQLE
jgi:hypothetical protein